MELRELYRFALVFGAKGCSKQISEPPAVGRRPQHHFTAPTERTPSRGPAGNGHPLVATMIGGGLEGYGSLAAVAGRKSTPFHGADGAGALQGIGRQRPSVGNDDRSRPGGLRSLVAVAGRKSTPFHGADRADALQGIGQQ